MHVLSLIPAVMFHLKSKLSTTGCTALDVMQA